MKRTRRKFTKKFKLQVVLDALKERQTLAELAIRYSIHANQISQWKREFLGNAENAFDGKSNNEAGQEAQVDKLYQKIGQLEVENDFLKKSLWKTGR